MASDLASESIYKSQPLPSYQQLFHQNHQLRVNLQTLLEYNNKLLSIIEDLNKGAHNSPASHERCAEESKFLWKKLSALESYSYQLEMELEGHRNQKQNEEQIERELKQVLESNEIVQKKFEMKIVQVLQEIEEIKGSQEVASERVMQFMEDRQQKVMDVYEQLEYKDEIIQLLTQKVKLFQEEYIKKQVRESGLSFKDEREREIESDRVREERGGRREREERGVQTEGGRREGLAEQELKEQRRVIEVYQNLLRKVRGKLEEKIS